MVHKKTGLGVDQIKNLQQEELVSGVTERLDWMEKHLGVVFFTRPKKGTNCYSQRSVSTAIPSCVTVENVNRIHEQEKHVGTRTTAYFVTSSQSIVKSLPLVRGDSRVRVEDGPRDKVRKE